jgi:hypothetical protein
VIFFFLLCAERPESKKHCNTAGLSILAVRSMPVNKNCVNQGDRLLLCRPLNGKGKIFCLCALCGSSEAGGELNTQNSQNKEH